MNSFWIITIAALILGSTMGGIAIEQKVNVVVPNAIAEIEEMKDMSCTDLREKNALGRYWTTSNGVYLRSLVDSCPPIKTNSGLNPYVEFCTPGGFAPVKDISNSTHKFDHDICQWMEK